MPLRRPERHSHGQHSIPQNGYDMVAVINRQTPKWDLKFLEPPPLQNKMYVNSPAQLAVVWPVVWVRCCKVSRRFIVFLAGVAGWESRAQTHASLSLSLSLAPQPYQHLQVPFKGTNYVYLLFEGSWTRHTWGCR